MKTFKDFIVEKKLTPAELAKREEVAQAIEKDDPSVDTSKKMAIATSVAKRVAEDTLNETPETKPRLLGTRGKAPIGSYAADKASGKYKELDKKFGKPAPVKESEQIEEQIKVTHEDPLVTVHQDGSLHTHANLSTANSIHGTSVKASDVHKGKVSTKNRDGKSVVFGISKHHATEVQEATSPFDWKNQPSAIKWNDDKADNSGVHKGTYGSDSHKAKGDGTPEEKRGRGRPKGEYGSYKIDKAKRDDPEYKQQLSAKVRAAKAEGFAARKEFKDSMNAAIKKRQLELAGIKQ